MNSLLPELKQFENNVFRTRQPLEKLLVFSLELMMARHVGLLYGTDESNAMFLPPDRWDRAVIHKFNGKGKSGLLLKYFGRQIVRMKSLSPVYLYKEGVNGYRIENDGIIPEVLRRHKDYYKQGLKICIIDNIAPIHETADQDAYNIAISSFDGDKLRPMPVKKVNTAIINHFKAKNFISAYVPDYGAIVFNTVDPDLLQYENGVFTNEDELKARLNVLMGAIEMASLANLGWARGKNAIKTIWRKENKLRQTAVKLQKKEKELDEQKSYLTAVGAVSSKQLNMDAENVSDGVFAFVDMVKSATIRKYFIPKDYFYIVNMCHQIAANNANRFSCRLDNFIGDAVFFQNTSIFDDTLDYRMDVEERVMLMITALTSYFHEIERLKSGCHPLDPSGRVKDLLEGAGSDLNFRAGIEVGTAMVGPLGSDERKIVTAIGKAVNNASRLESSGEPQFIQANRNVKQIIQNAYVSKETPTLKKILDDISVNNDNGRNGYYRFINWFTSHFQIIEPLITEKKDVSFKEFSKEKTFLIKTLPDAILL